MPLSMLQIIERKKLNIELNDQEIQFFVKGVCDNSIPDYQISAFLMAICFNGLSERETAILTREMANSGSVSDLSAFGDYTVDKHSTGGIGDKITLVLAPLLGAMGCITAKMSGRSLGFTGGTIDKLESIKGFTTQLPHQRFMSQVKEIGVCVAGQTENFVPADKKLYALRDVTATVDIIPLIASSIMCKKLAGGAKNILLDVKCGSGAFMKTKEEAEKLGDAMVKIAKDNGRNAVALITSMDEPIGDAVGNALEVKEAISVLKGKCKNTVFDLSIEFASRLYAMSFKRDYQTAKSFAVQCIENGKAYEKFIQMVKAQGGDVSCSGDPILLDNAKYTKKIYVKDSGYISCVNGETIGRACMLMGAGRQKKGDSIDLSAGLINNSKIGQYKNKGDLLVTLKHNIDNEKLLQEIEEMILSAFELAEKEVVKQPLILDCIF